MRILSFFMVNGLVFQLCSFLCKQKNTYYCFDVPLRHCCLNPLIRVHVDIPLERDAHYPRLFIRVGSAF